MRTYLRSLAIIALIVALAIPSSFAHSYVTTPVSRSNQRQSNSGCRGPACLGPCDVPKARAGQVAAVTVQRGQQLDIHWPRNNHAAGFIRFAWAPFEESDSHTAFDNNVQQVVCHEIGGCAPGDPKNPNGGDPGPADGSTRSCAASLTVPKHLPDGKWTLQWAWFGGAFQLGDYYSCVDYQIVGGPTASRSAPVFKGGDYSYPNQQKCKYFNTNALHVCVNEPCTAGPEPGEHAGAVANKTLWGTGAAPAPTPNPDPEPSSDPQPTSPPDDNTPPQQPTGCTVGTTRCKATPEAAAGGYQCCSAGVTCTESGEAGVCCGPAPVIGCIYGDATSKKSACCDSRYTVCDAVQGCKQK